MATGKEIAFNVLKNESASLLTEWLGSMRAAGALGDGRTTDAEVGAEGKELLDLLPAAIAAGSDVSSKEWSATRNFLEGMSRARALKGFSSVETATFIFSLKKPLFLRLRQQAAGDAQALADATWEITELVDALGLHAVKSFQKSREEVIARQQEEMLELSTPVVKLWDGVLALPMIGTLDSSRTQVVMESLLQRIVETGAEIAIIDITGVPTVDTLVAQHLLKTVTAIRLMGADCIISGIRPQIAQTIVHLGVELHGVTTKATLADALAIALKRAGLTVTKVKAA
jgi:rsbT co-antagonist protein RsbR